MINIKNVDSQCKLTRTHCRDGVSVPPSQWVVKRHGTKKYIGHVGYVGSIPCINILIKSFGILKHRPHCRHTTRVPTVQRLIERSGRKKHLNHVGHFGCIPVVETLVKRGGSIEQTTHVCHISHIPPTFHNLVSKSVPCNFFQQRYATIMLACVVYFCWKQKKETRKKCRKKLENCDQYKKC